MITVQFNDKKILLEPNTTLLYLLQQQPLHTTAFAVAINRKFVARSQYDTTVLQLHDVIETVSPMQGG